MSLQVEKLEHNMAKLTIEVPAEDVEKALQAAYLKERSKISLPGFRKGKVPRQMIEKMYGPEVFYDEAANHMISEAYGKAFDECELEIVSQPKIEVTQLEKGKSFIFTAEVAVKPEVTLGEYKGLKVDKVSTRVTQKEVDEEIEKERERNARTIDVTDRAVQDKDMVTLDFEGFVDGEAFEGGKGENYPLTIGSVGKRQAKRSFRNLKFTLIPSGRVQKAPCFCYTIRENRKQNRKLFQGLSEEMRREGYEQGTF